MYTSKFFSERKRKIESTQCGWTNKHFDEIILIFFLSKIQTGFKWNKCQFQYISQSKTIFIFFLYFFFWFFGRFIFFNLSSNAQDFFVTQKNRRNKIPFFFCFLEKFQRIRPWTFNSITQCKWLQWSCNCFVLFFIWFWLLLVFYFILFLFPFYSD